MAKIFKPDRFAPDEEFLPSALSIQSVETKAEFRRGMRLVGTEFGLIAASPSLMIRRPVPGRFSGGKTGGGKADATGTCFFPKNRIYPCEPMAGCLVQTAKRQFFRKFCLYCYWDLSSILIFRQL